MPGAQEERSSGSKHSPLLPAAQQRLHPDTSTSSHRKSPYKENNHSHKKEESKKNHLEPSAAAAALHSRSEVNSGGNHIAQCAGPSKISGPLDGPDDNGKELHTSVPLVVLVWTRPVWTRPEHDLTTSFALRSQSPADAALPRWEERTDRSIF